MEQHDGYFPYSQKIIVSGQINFLKIEVKLIGIENLLITSNID